MQRLLGCIYTGPDHIPTQLGRGMQRLLGCIYTSHIPTQLQMQGCLAAFTQALIPIREVNARLLGCIYTGPDHIPTQLGR